MNVCSRHLHALPKKNRVPTTTLIPIAATQRGLKDPEKLKAFEPVLTIYIYIYIPVLQRIQNRQSQTTFIKGDSTPLRSE